MYLLGCSYWFIAHCYACFCCGVLIACLQAHRAHCKINILASNKVLLKTTVRKIFFFHNHSDDTQTSNRADDFGFFPTLPSNLSPGRLVSD